MSESLDKRLRAALRPVEPDEGFVADVMARIDADSSAEARDRSSASSSRYRRTRWVGAALAASLLVAALVGLQVHQRHEREAALRAKQQVLDALYLTSEKLNLAYRVVRDQADSSGSASDQSSLPNARPPNGSGDAG